MFYFADKKLGKNGDNQPKDEMVFTNKISLSGTKNFLWLMVVIISVFLDPNVLEWVPAIHYDGQKFSFIR